MATTERYITVIELNSEQAQKEIKSLEEKIASMKTKREEDARSSPHLIFGINVPAPL